MDPNIPSITTYQLHQQSVLKVPEVLRVDSDELFKTARVTKKFRVFESKSLEFPTGIEIKVAVAYPTDKKQKIAPLRETIQSYIKQQEESRGVSIKIEEFFFKVKHTGVGEQPLHPDGYVGALNRIYYIQDALLGGQQEEQQSFILPAIQDFHRIIIPSLESDIYHDEGVIYDKPNVIFYECFTGHFVAGMGTGPRVQEDIFQLAQSLGCALFNNAKAVTYGKVLQTLFPQLEIDHADWHRVVCRPQPDGKKRDRAYFIKELCGALDKPLAGFFEKVFHPEEKTS
jgi:hypothetical protein